MKRFIALVLMMSVFFTATLSAAPKVAENPTTVEYSVQEQEQEQPQTDELIAAKKHAIIDFVGTLILGELGFHQFYNGHIGMGILFIFTGGLFGIGYVYSVVVTLINVVEICI